MSGEDGRTVGLGLGARAAALPRPLAWLGVLWRFSRPHTVIGTTVSVVAIYLIAVSSLPGLSVGDGVSDLFWTLVAALCVNVYIVGLNQLEDEAIDRINKPWLPIAAGELSRGRAWAIVLGTGGLAIVLAVTQGWPETVFVVAALLVGTAYSSPPLRLKRYPTLASLSISGVRSIVVNLGVYLHFAQHLPADPTWAIPDAIWALTLFVLPFSFAIAILKDVPDMDGDRRFEIVTFTLRLGPRRVLHVAVAALTAAYLGMAILGPLLLAGLQPAVLVVGDLLALALLWRWTRAVDVEDREGFTAYYMGIWKLFFLQYAIVATAALAG